jgi:hypothetical protein|tara:strand:+ start:1064 stop:1297 length:234 start_codon:yes stop_codon:yes gene_type:complete
MKLEDMPVQEMNQLIIEAVLSRMKEEYSEDRWITLIDPCRDSSPPDTYEAGYNAACGVLRVVLCELMEIADLNEKEE